MTEKSPGHYKTFTENRPLFGKHVGTYWWGGYVDFNPGQLSFDDLTEKRDDGQSEGA